MTNLQMSEQLIARILSRLLERGFQDGGLAFEDLDLSEDYRRFFDSSVLWLNAEGIIRYDEFKRIGGYQGMFNPTLTSKGFAILDDNVSRSEESVPLKEVLPEVSNDPSLWSKVGDFTGSFLGSLAKSMGS